MRSLLKGAFPGKALAAEAQAIADKAAAKYTES
jgi:hypothetical protein